MARWLRHRSLNREVAGSSSGTGSVPLPPVLGSGREVPSPVLPATRRKTQAPYTTGVCTLKIPRKRKTFRFFFFSKFHPRLRTNSSPCTTYRNRLYSTRIFLFFILFSFFFFFFFSSSLFCCCCCCLLACLFVDQYDLFEQNPSSPFFAEKNNGYDPRPKRVGVRRFQCTDGRADRNGDSYTEIKLSTTTLLPVAFFVESDPDLPWESLRSGTAHCTNNAPHKIPR